MSNEQDDPKTPDNRSANACGDSCAAGSRGCETQIIEDSRVALVSAGLNVKNSGAKKLKLKTFGCPGPFQVIDQSVPDGTPRSELDHPAEGPKRRYDCGNYETCLNLAAALNWDSFTCRGCCREINEKLLWRAQHEVRKDLMAKAICELPDPRDRKIENCIPLPKVASSKG